MFWKSQLSLTVLFYMAIAMTTHVAMADNEALEKADNFYKARKWDQAIEQYEAAAKAQSPKDAAQSRFRIGLAYRYRGRNQQSIDALTQALETDLLEPATAARARLEIGYCLYLSRRFDEALASLNSAIDDPNAAPSTRSDGCFYAGYILNKQKKYDEAIKYFLRVTRDEEVHFYSRSQAWLLTGNVYRVMKQYDDARDAYRQAIKIAGVKGTNGVRAQTKLDELDTILGADEAFYIKPFISQVSGSEATIYWVVKGDASDTDVALIGGGQNQTIKTRALDIAEGGFVHLAAHAKGLQHSTLYKYVARVHNKTFEGSFKTALQKDEPYNFCVMGDTQTMAPVHTKVGIQIAKYKPDFVLHCGDHVESGSQWFQWKSQLFKPGEPYLPHTVFWPARGNHDGGPYYPRLFGLQKAQYYSFDYGNMRVLFIDSFGPALGGKRRLEHVRWFEEQLKNNDKLWTIVCVHDPMMSTDSVNHWYGEDDFLPLVQQYEVDFVFSGHHHMYRRFMPVALPGKNPTIHITTGGSGGGLGGNYPSPILHKGDLIHHHLNFHVDGNKLEMTAVTMEGEVLDTLSLIKTNGKYQSEMLEQSVDFATARKIASFLYEFTVPRTDNKAVAQFSSTPEPGKPLKLKFDMSRLPQGNIDPAQFPAGTKLLVSQSSDSPWQVKAQSISIASGVIEFELTAPKNLIVKDGAVYPRVQVMLGAELDGRKFNSFRFNIVPANRLAKAE